jgi:hypothetical protein
MARTAGNGNARPRVTRTAGHAGDEGGGGSGHRLYIASYVLPVLAALVVAFAVTNPMGFDWPARIVGIVAFSVVAGIAVHIAGWREVPWERLRSFWWLWTVVGLIGGTILGSFVTTSPVSDLMLDYGEREDVGALYAMVNGNLLLRYKNDYKIILIALIPYADIDKMTDTRIEKSSLYTITEGYTTLGITSVAHLRITAPSGFTGGITRNFTLLYVAIIPNNVAPEEIASLYDVNRVGGRIMEGRGLNVEYSYGPHPSPHG